MRHMPERLVWLHQARLLWVAEHSGAVAAGPARPHNHHAHRTATNLAQRGRNQRPGVPPSPRAGCAVNPVPCGTLGRTIF